MVKYDNGIKEQILAMIAAGRDPKELAKEYGISGTTISNWRRASDDPKIKPKSLETALQAENKTLKQQIKRLEMERDVLKKAMVIISAN
jgi:transposase